MHLRLAEGLPGPEARQRVRLAKARGQDNAGERLARRDQALHEGSREGKARLRGRIGPRPGEARFQCRRPGQGAVRRHHVRTHQGRLYLAVVMDVRSRKVVGRPMAPGMTAEPADDALKMAIAHRGPERGRLHHSDHGSRYVSPLIGKTMGEGGIMPFVGSVSSPWDNAVTESRMGTMKAVCVHARTFSGREEVALEIFEYLECFYDRIRIHSALGRLSPEEFEKKQMEESRSKAA